MADDELDRTARRSRREGFDHACGIAAVAVLAAAAAGAFFESGESAAMVIAGTVLLALGVASAINQFRD